MLHIASYVEANGFTRQIDHPKHDNIFWLVKCNIILIMWVIFTPIFVNNSVFSFNEVLLKMP